MAIESGNPCSDRIIDGRRRAAPGTTASALWPSSWAMAFSPISAFPVRIRLRFAHRALGPAKEFNLTEAMFGRECVRVATTEGKRIQATQTSRRWVRRGRKSG